MEALGAVVALGAAMLVWAARGAIAPGSAGLCVMWAVQFVISLNFNTINLTEAESKLTSVERVKEYSNLPQEPPHSIPHMSPPPSWPSKGELVFNDVEMTYREGLPPALKGLCAVVRGGERVGIVGRTGAGKSRYGLYCGG